ncbi:MAG: hypothetical protein R3E39_17410 [Anaerolineae bacterium]
MTSLNRDDLEVRYALFQKFALEDQRNYYNNTLGKLREAAGQVNRYRAFFAFMTGFSSALAGFIVQSAFISGARCTADPLPSDCGTLTVLVSFFIVMSVVMPALGAFFTTLADLYQWDRTITIYEGAVENIEFADAQSPINEMDDPVYRASLTAYTEGTLLVMSDETAQWGQSIRTPPQTAEFIARMEKHAEQFKGVADPSQQEPPPPPKD